MRGQLSEMKDTSLQTRQAAKAAKESADALINSERAWVMVDVRFVDHPFEVVAGKHKRGKILPSGWCAGMMEGLLLDNQQASPSQIFLLATISAGDS